MIVLIDEIEKFFVKVLASSPKLSAQIFERLVPVAEGREESCRVKVGSQERCPGERFWVWKVVIRRIIVAELEISCQTWFPLEYKTCPVNLRRIYLT